MKKVLETFKLKWSEYLLEIIVIMIGILGAFALNNWNENRLMRKEEIVVLKSLLAEFEDNIEELNRIYRLQEIKNESIGILLSSDPSQMSIEAMDSLFINTMSFWTSNPSRSIYSTTVNTGHIHLISNENLKNRISKVDELLTDYMEQEVYLYEFHRDHLYPEILEHNYFNYSAINSSRAEEQIMNDHRNYQRALSSEEFRGQLQHMRVLMTLIFVDGPTAMMEIKEIVQSLDAEIEKLE